MQTTCFNTPVMTESLVLIKISLNWSSLWYHKWEQNTQSVSRKKKPPLAFAAATDDWYDSKPIQTANFTHDWGSIGCNEMAFLNIALEWLCYHQYNSCYYSFGSSTHFSLYQVQCVISAELRVNPRGFGFLLLRMWPFSPLGAIHSVNWPPQSLSRFMESLKGHRRLPGETIQGAGLASELQLGEFLGFLSTFINSLPFFSDPGGNLHYIEELYLNRP